MSVYVFVPLSVSVVFLSAYLPVSLSLYRFSVFLSLCIYLSVFMSLNVKYVSISLRVGTLRNDAVNKAILV